MIKTRIQIGDYYLNSDFANWWISEVRYTKKGKYKGKEYEENITGYCWTLDKAIQTFAQRVIGRSDATTLEELLTALRDAYTAVSELVNVRDDIAFEQSVKKIEEIKNDVDRHD